MAKNKDSERRKFPRVEVKVPVKFTIVQAPSGAKPEAHPAALGQTENVSHAGVCLALRSSLLPGTVVNLRLSFPRKDDQGLLENEEIHMKGRVIWTRILPSGQFLTGMEYISGDEEGGLDEGVLRDISRASLAPGSPRGRWFSVRKEKNER